MSHKPSNEERLAFSERFKTALQGVGIEVSPTIIQRQFNARGVSVTVHAVRKWIMGEAIPTQDKIRQIAKWLGVKPDWLRWGEGTDEQIEVGTLSTMSVSLLDSFGRLKERDKGVVMDLIESMLKRSLQ